MGEKKQFLMLPLALYIIILLIDSIYNVLLMAPETLAMKSVIIHSHHIHDVGGKLWH